MLRRRRRQPEAPQPPWRARVDAARELVRRHGGGAVSEARLDELERALVAAEEDHAALAAAIEGLGGDRPTQELKAAMRERDRRPGGDDVIERLRQRHLAVQQLQNQLDDLRARIDVTVADLELLAARTVELAVGRRELGAAASTVEAELERLHVDLTALDAAHRELREL
jgi:chromosome segregation ATPase